MNIGYIIFHELTGVNVIVIYSTLLFQKMDKSGGRLTPRQGTYLVGIIGLISTWIGILSVKTFGRKTLCLLGHLAIAVVHGLVAYFDIIGSDAGVLSSIIVFMFIYQNTTGPVAWLYAIETTIDAAFGICVFVLWLTSFTLSLICPILMSDEYLGPSNVFFIFSGLSVLGALYV